MRSAYKIFVKKTLRFQFEDPAVNGSKIRGTGSPRNGVPTGFVWIRTQSNDGLLRTQL
jgi:hypothetical protein